MPKAFPTEFRNDVVAVARRGEVSKHKSRRGHPHRGERDGAEGDHG